MNDNSALVLIVTLLIVFSLSLKIVNSHEWFLIPIGAGFVIGFIFGYAIGRNRDR